MNHDARPIFAIAQAGGAELVWSQPRSFRMEYELHAGDNLAATLYWQKSFGSLAHAIAADGHWTLKRSGFLRPHITVRVAGADANIASLEANLSGAGTLRFKDNRVYRWLNINFWEGEWVFAADDKTPLVRFLNARAASNAKGRVNLEPGALTHPDLSLLCIVGWYLIILMAADIGAQSATTA